MDSQPKKINTPVNKAKRKVILPLNGTAILGIINSRITNKKSKIQFQRGIVVF